MSTRSSRKRNASVDPITPERKKGKASVSVVIPRSEQLRVHADYLKAPTPPSLPYGSNAFSDTQASSKGKKVVDDQLKSPSKPVQDRSAIEQLRTFASGSSPGSHQVDASKTSTMGHSRGQSGSGFSAHHAGSDIASPVARGSGKKLGMFELLVSKGAQQTPSASKQGSPFAPRSAPTPALSVARRMYPAGVNPSDAFEEDCFDRAVAAKNSDVAGELSNWPLPAVYGAFCNFIAAENLTSLNPRQYMPAPANAQAKPNPLVIGVETPMDTPAPEHFVAKTVEVEQPAANKGKQPASQDELDKFMRTSIPDPGSDDESSDDSDHDSEASSVEQVAGSSSDARLHGTPRKAPCFNCMIKICTRSRPGICRDSTNTRIKRCTGCRRGRKCEPVPESMMMLASMVLDALNSGDSETFKKLKKSFADTAIETRKLMKVAAVKVDDEKRKSLGLKPKNRARGKKTGGESSAQAELVAQPTIDLTAEDDEMSEHFDDDDRELGDQGPVEQNVSHGEHQGTPPPASRPSDRSGIPLNATIGASSHNTPFGAQNLGFFQSIRAGYSVVQDGPRIRAFGQWFESVSEYNKFLFDHSRRRAHILADEILDCILDTVWAGIGPDDP